MAEAGTCYTAEIDSRNGGLFIYRFNLYYTVYQCAGRYSSYLQIQIDTVNYLLLIHSNILLRVACTPGILELSRYILNKLPQVVTQSHGLDWLLPTVFLIVTNSYIELDFVNTFTHS
jgi:hypothetical protein